MKQRLKNNKLYKKYKSSIIRIIKYTFSAGSSFAIDIALFTLFNYLLKNILIATIIARVISSLYNYFINSKYVFEKYSKSSIVKYYILVVIQMFASGFSVTLLSNIFKSINDTVIKVFVDICIFIVNYIVQKEVVFK